MKNNIYISDDAAGKKGLGNENGILLIDVRQKCFIHNDNVGQAKKEQNAAINNIFIIQIRY